MLAVAKTMITEIFGGQLPDIVDIEFAATYVLMISVFNMLGRFIWASASDYMGRRNTYYVFFGLGILLYCSIPYFAQQVAAFIARPFFCDGNKLLETRRAGGHVSRPSTCALEYA